MATVHRRRMAGWIVRLRSWFSSFPNFNCRPLGMVHLHAASQLQRPGCASLSRRLANRLLGVSGEDLRNETPPRRISTARSTEDQPASLIRPSQDRLHLRIQQETRRLKGKARVNKKHFAEPFASVVAYCFLRSSVGVRACMMDLSN